MLAPNLVFHPLCPESSVLLPFGSSQHFPAHHLGSSALQLTLAMLKAVFCNAVDWIEDAEVSFSTKEVGGLSVTMDVDIPRDLSRCTVLSTIFGCLFHGCIEHG